MNAHQSYCHSHVRPFIIILIIEVLCCVLMHNMEKNHLRICGNIECTLRGWPLAHVGALILDYLSPSTKNLTHTATEDQNS